MAIKAPVRRAGLGLALAALLAAVINGVWGKEGSSFRFGTDPPPLTAAAKAKIDAMRSQDKPGALRRAGHRRMMNGPGPWEIVTMDNHILMASEFSHAVRRIWTDMS